MTNFRALGVLACLATFATAQNQTLLFTGRFPFVSLDAVNERVGGSISNLSEFEFSYVTPGQGAVARSLLPAAGMQCYLADANNDGNYLKFDGFRTYFENLQIGSLFVKHADRGAASWDKVFFTVRDNVATKDLEVFTNGGTAVHTLVAGDWVRLLPNGNVEFFLTAAQLAVAAGVGTGASVPGAHALAQTANGDLYYAPVQGGQWVNGNQGGPVFCNDGAIVKIAAADITYDASGNVLALAPNSARLIIEEVNAGPSPQPLTVRQMVLNSGAMDRAGNPIAVAGVFGKVSGLALDPNGGTFQSTYPDLQGNFTQEPNLVFCGDAGGYAGTIFSTANLGSIATINGVLCGSNIPAVPATGSWLGVQFDSANFQPSLMGLQVVDGLAAEPFTLDQNGYGALPLSTTQPLWEVDMHTDPFAVAFLIASFGPLAPGGIVPSLPLAAYPPVFVPNSFGDVFVGAGASTFGLAVTDGNGYGTWTFANPNNGGFTGVTFTLQAAAIVGGQFRTSNPLLTQLR
ncbi:MAG: hypothetical protein RL398_3515 [Planctomycetota bacterium]